MLTSSAWTAWLLQRNLQRLSSCSGQVHPSQDSTTKTLPALGYPKHQEAHQQAWQNLPQDEENRLWGPEDRSQELKTHFVQRQLRRSYWNYLNTVFTGEDTPDQAGKNKWFWSCIKHQKPSDTGVAPLKKDGHLTSDHKAQAELLNGQFQSVTRTVSVSLRRWQTVHSRRVWAEDWNGWQRHTRNWWYQDIRAKSEDAYGGSQPIQSRRTALAPECWENFQRS